MKSVVFLFLFALCASLSAQSLEGLQAINAKAKNTYVQPEVLDQLMIGLRPYDDASFTGKDSLLMDTYKIIANGYSANNHFRQAYEVYRHYLNFKQSVLLKHKKETIAIAQQNVNDKKNKGDDELMVLKNNVESLKIDYDVLKNKRSSFKRYASVILLTLSALFAAMLVSSGVRMSNYKTQLKQNRKKMKEIQRQAVVGNLSEGIRLSLINSITELEQSVKDLQTGDNATKQSLQQELRNLKSQLAG